MPKRIVRIPRNPIALDIVSHGRRGPAAASSLAPEQVEQIKRTVRRTPEVIVKVSGGARDAGGAKAHFDYIDRHGNQAIVTDDGRELLGKGAGAELVADWNLDLCRGQYRVRPAAGDKDRRPKLVHNIVLAMPGRTPPEAVLEAARKFARENFALQHRYAMVLHTDQKHPHVHLVVKAEHEFEPGKRLHIDKAMLRRWREQFAACLREQGVAANATPGYVRGRARTAKKDPIHQRMKALREHQSLPPEIRERRRAPKESTFMRAKVEAVGRELQRAGLASEPGKAKLMATREAVTHGWLVTARALRAQGEVDLAREVERFVAVLPAVRTEREQIAAGLLAQIDAQRRRQQARDTPPSEPDRFE
jgi:hypothetical protein